MPSQVEFAMLLPTEIDHEGNIFRRAASGRGWEGGGGFLAWPMRISSHLVPRFQHPLPTLLVLHDWGVLPGRMHKESKELCGSGVFLGHMLYRNARRVAGEYSLAFYVHSATNCLLLLPAQPIMHGWGVLSGRMQESKDNTRMAGEYSPAER